jgi:hypothetical protein
MSKKYAVVKFLSTKDEGYADGYHYENNIGAKKYDTVIVPTRYGVSMAVVESLTDDIPQHIRYTSIKAVAEVIQSKTVTEMTREQKRKDLEKRLEKKVKALDKLERFKAYADSNPEIAELVKELEEI